MKYKQLYIDAQKRFSEKLNSLEKELCNISKDLSYMETRLEERRDELSPELYDNLLSDIMLIKARCWIHETGKFDETIKGTKAGVF